MKKLILLFVFVFSALTMFAQSNVASMGLTGLSYGNFSFGYERVLSEKISLKVGASYMIPRELPFKKYFVDNYEELAENDMPDNPLTAMKMNGISANFEFRFYPGGEGPKGLYLAPFFKYTKYSFNAEYVDKTSYINEVGYKLDGSLNLTGGGLLIGYQWLIKERVTVDWWFVGPAVYAGKAVANLKAENMPADDSMYDVDYSAYDDIPYLGLEVDVKSRTEAEITTEKLVPGYRFGLSVGFAF